MSLSEIQALHCLCNVFIHLIWAYVASQFVNRLFDLVQDIHLQRPTPDPEEDSEEDESEEEEDESDESEEEDPKDPGSEDEDPKESEEAETQEPAAEAPWRPLIQTEP